MQQKLQNKRNLVSEVFDKVYDKYDLMNNLMSLGIHKSWKRQLVYSMNPGKNKKLIDVACGTGDIAKLFIEATNSKLKVQCVDPNKKMISLGKKNLKIIKIYPGELPLQKTYHLMTRNLIITQLALD